MVQTLIRFNMKPEVNEWVGLQKFKMRVNYFPIFLQMISVET